MVKDLSRIILEYEIAVLLKPDYRLIKPNSFRNLNSQNQEGCVCVCVCVCVRERERERESIKGRPINEQVDACFMQLNLATFIGLLKIFTERSIEINNIRYG